MGIFTGPVSAAQGLGIILSSPRMLALALVPALVTLGVSILGGWLAAHFSAELLVSLWPEPSSWLLYPLWWLVSLVLELASVLLAVLITPWLVMLVGLPLCEPLSAAIDEHLGGTSVKGTFWGEIARTLTATLGITLLGLSGAIAFLLLGLIPGVGLLTTPFVALVWTPSFLAFDLCDSPLARRQLGFRQKLGVLRSRPFTTISIGLTGTLLLSIPVLNLIGLPVAVAMGVVAMRTVEKAGGLPLGARPKAKGPLAPLGPSSDDPTRPRA